MRQQVSIREPWKSLQVNKIEGSRNPYFRSHLYRPMFSEAHAEATEGRETAPDTRMASPPSTATKRVDILNIEVLTFEFPYDIPLPVQGHPYFRPMQASSSSLLASTSRRNSHN